MNKIILIYYKILFRILTWLVDKVIYLHWKLYKYDLEQHELINSSIPKTDLYATNDIDKAYITASHIKKRYRVYRLILDNGLELDCADDHKVCTTFGYLEFVKDLKAGMPIMTKQGIGKVVKVKDLGYSTFMFDLTVATEDKLFYSNDILSSNSIVTGIFIVWYLINHSDRNVLLVSQSTAKVKELMDKVDVILKGLPFYMKPGVFVNNMFTKTFDSGCKLVAETTTTNSGASFTIHLLYSDEFALVHHSYIRDFFRTIFPTLSSSDISRMIITSTPRGMNKFYDIYNDAINSKNRFNPIRTDWYEVPMGSKELEDRGYTKEQIKKLQSEGKTVNRDKKWKQDQVNDLGSEEDFNQEYGNQFLAGNSLLFRTSILRNMKKNQVHFIHHDIDVLDDAGIEYKGILIWHPKFDPSNVFNRACQFCTSIDLADGSGGDYSVVNIFQIIPMSKKEIDELSMFTEDKDFFKLVQIGIIRSNTTDIPELGKLYYHLVCDVFIQENLKTTLEMNHEGNYFKGIVNTVYADKNKIEPEHLWVAFSKDVTDDDVTATKTGLNNNEKYKDYACKIIKDKVKHKQMVLTEHMTVEESLSFAKNKKGKYESQTGHDDCMMTCVNKTHYYETDSFVEQIDEMMQYLPQGFIDAVNKKLGRLISRHTKDDDDDDYDLYDD